MNPCRLDPLQAQLLRDSGQGKDVEVVIVHLLGDEPFVVVNGDVYCELDYGELVNTELGDALGCLYLTDNPDFHPEGDFSIRDGYLEIKPELTFSGMAVYSPDSDQEVMQVFKRADSLMYENKSELKSKKYLESFRKTERLNTPITDERRRRLNGLFGALYTMSGDGYVFLNDMKCPGGFGGSG